MRVRSLHVALALAVAACSGRGGEVDDLGGPGVVRAPARRGSVVLVGCALSGEQQAALESTPMKRLVEDVIVACLSVDGKGELQPSADVAGVLGAVASLGYSAKLGVAVSAPGAVLAEPQWLRSPAQRASTIASIQAVANGYGAELDLRYLPSTAGLDLAIFVEELAGALHPGGTLGVLVPSSAADPSGSGLAGVLDVEPLAAKVDRVRVLTTDYSSPLHPGPTIDSGWAVDSARRVLEVSGRTPVDVSVPLYGWSFEGAHAQQVSYAQAHQRLAADEATLERAPGGAPWFDARGRGDQVWFTDATSSVLTLAAWQTDVLPPAVGVVFYGLGSEDPVVWQAVMEVSP
jgi:hypothetical protein